MTLAMALSSRSSVTCFKFNQATCLGLIPLIERDIQGLQNELKELEQTLTARQHRHSELTQRNTQLETQLTELQKHYDALCRENHCNGAELSELKQQYDRQDAQFAQVRTELQDSRESHQELQKSLVELEQTKQTLEQKLTELNAVIETQKEFIEQCFRSERGNPPKKSDNS